MPAVARAALPVAAAALVYLAYAMWVTWPVPLDLRTTLYGPGGDVVGGITDMREIAQHSLGPFFPGTVESLGYPAGRPIPYPLYVATWVSALPLWLGTLTVGGIAAMNLFVLAGLVLTGLSMFLLVRWRTGDWMIALLAGWALAFLPNALFNAGTAPDTTHRWPLVLLLWRMLVLRDAPTRRNGLLAGAAGVVAVSSNSYHLLIGTVEFAALAVAALFVALRGRALAATVRSLAWAVAPMAGAAIVYAVVAATAEHSGVRGERDIEHAYTFSLRPPEFLDPVAQSTLLGWLDLPQLRDAATDVYFGLTVFALAVAAVVLAVRRARDARADVLTLAWLFVVGVVWAGPPTVQLAGVTVYLPAWFVSQLTTTWRIYGRFSALVHIAVVMLAAIGLWLLVRRLRRNVRTALVAAAAVLVVLDLSTPGLEMTFRQQPSPVYQALRGLPPGAVAEYPLLGHGFGFDQIFRQELHHRPVLNGYDPQSAAERRALSLARLDDRTVERLRELNVRYVVLDTGLPQPPGTTAPGPPSKRLRLIGESPPFALYEVPGTGPVPYRR